MWIRKCATFIFFGTEAKVVLWTFYQKFWRITYLERLTFFILNYGHHHHICFRMAIIRQSKAGGEGGKVIPSVHLFGTHCTLHILFLYIIFTTVPESISKFFISHHDSLKINKIDALRIKAKRKSFTEKLGHTRHETTQWAYCEMIRSPSCFYVVFSTKVSGHLPAEIISLFERIFMICYRTLTILNIIWERDF